MATLQLVRFDDGRGYALQGTGDPTRNADFSLFDVDGEGGDPFTWGNASWEVVDEIGDIDYDPDDRDSFWRAQEWIVTEAKAKGIELPAYAYFFEEG